MINKTKLFTYKNSKNTVYIFYDRNVLKKYTADYL